MAKSKKQHQTKASKSVSLITFPRELEDALGPKPILPFESTELYETLQSQVIEAIKPQNALEFMDVRNFIDLTWSIIRVRRHVWVSLRHKQWEIIAEKLLKEFEDDWIKAQKADFLSGKKETLATLTQCLLELSLSIEDIERIAFSQLSSQIEHYELLLAQLEARRTLLLREIDRRRDTLARRLRENMPMIEAKVIETSLESSTTADESVGPSSEAA